MTKDQLILMLANQVYICSRLLTCAAERLDWDSEKVQDLIREFKLEENDLLKRILDEAPRC